MTPCILTTHFIAVLVGVACFSAIKNQVLVEPYAASRSCTPEDKDWGSTVNLQCGDRNLTSVPITKYNKPVSLLNVSHNVLQILAEDALLSYESVRYLYLHHCKIVNINEKAFQRLENLTEIDLASNSLTSVSPNLFNSNQKLDKLILQNNNLGSLQWNTPIMNGPSSLSFLDLQSCKLSNISSITFSLLPNLTFLDISRNELVLLKTDTLSSHQNLKDVNLRNNPWKCGTMFKALLCWMYSHLVLPHSRTVKCQHRNGSWEKWSTQNQSSLCNLDSTPLDTSLHDPGTSKSTKVNAATTQSHELDISTSMTLKPIVSLEEELDFNSAQPFILVITLGLLLFEYAIGILLLYFLRNRT